MTSAHKFFLGTLVLISCLAGSVASADDKKKRFLAWGKKVTPAFRTKVRKIAANLGVNASHLMTIMAFETNRSFSPKQTTKSSSAVGLIQFMPPTAKQLGTTSKKLKAMSAIKQLDYVEKYFKQFKKKKFKTLTDVYLAVLYPAAMGKSKNHVVFDGTSSSKRQRGYYLANRLLDKDKDKKVQQREIAAFIHRYLKEGLKKGNVSE
jgi:hypothetical protein